MKPKSLPYDEAARKSAGLACLMLGHMLREVHAGRFGFAWRDRVSSDLHFRSALRALEAGSRPRFGGARE